MKNTAKIIEETRRALLAIEQDQIALYQASDKRTKGANKALAMGEQAKHLVTTLNSVWSIPIKHLRALMHDQYHAPIHSILAEVIAAKVEARARRKAKEQQAITQAFSLEARARFA